MDTNIEKLLFKNNIKLTEQRKLILKITLDSIDHPSADEIYRKAQGYDQSISMATVYRTIALLEQHGFIDKLNFNDGKARYESKNKTHSNRVWQKSKHKSTKTPRTVRKVHFHTHFF